MNMAYCTMLKFRNLSALFLVYSRKKYDSNNITITHYTNESSSFASHEDHCMSNLKKTETIERVAH